MQNNYLKYKEMAKTIILKRNYKIFSVYSLDTLRQQKQLKYMNSTASSKQERIQWKFVTLSIRSVFVPLQLQLR